MGSLAMCVVLLLLLLAAAPGASGGAPRPRLVGTAVTSLYSDGVRWAAYEPMPGTTRIMDARTGRWTTRRDPEGCARGLVAVGSGYLLYWCGTNRPCQVGFAEDGGCALVNAHESYLYTNYVVEDIATGVALPVAGDGVCRSMTRRRPAVPR